jgi:hypothetical protein
MKFLRSQSQVVLVMLLAILGLGFILYGNVGNILATNGNHGSSDYGAIEGDTLTGSDIFDAVRNTRYTLILENRAQELSQPKIGPALAEEAWRQKLLEHEADKLHIEVTNQELLDFIHNNRLFQDPKTGQYSPDVYQNRIAQLQGLFRIPNDNGPDPLVTTRAVVENVFRQLLRSMAVQKALFSTIRTPASDVSAAYEQFYGPATVSIVTFDPKAYLTSATVTPDDIAAEYKNNPQNPAYRTKEKRKVDYVIFPLTPDQAKLPDKDKAEALNALGQKALNFALTFQPDPSLNPQGSTPPDFVTEAKKQGLTPATTDFFTVDSPPAGLAPSPAFNNAAFDLTKDEPVSKVIELSDGVAVIHLNEIQPSDLLPFDQVKAAIQDQLQQAKAVQAAGTAAKDASQALQSILGQGGNFKDTATKLNLKVETMNALVPGKIQGEDPKLQTIAYVVPGLEPGKLSPPIPMENDNTTILIYVDSRDKADPAGMAEFETRYRQSQDDNLRMQAYFDWANWMEKKPGTHKPPDLDQFGSIE